MAEKQDLPPQDAKWQGADKRYSLTASRRTKITATCGSRAPGRSTD